MIRLLLLMLVLWTVPAQADLAPIIVNVTSGSGSFSQAFPNGLGLSAPGEGVGVGDFGFVSPLGGTFNVGVACGSSFSSQLNPQFPGYNDEICSAFSDPVFFGQGTLTIAKLVPTHVLPDTGGRGLEGDPGTYTLPLAVDFTARPCGLRGRCDPTLQPVEFVGTGMWTVRVVPGGWFTQDLFFGQEMPEPATWVLLLTGLGLLMARSLASSRSRV